jgi:hypothetical protein
MFAFLLSLCLADGRTVEPSDPSYGLIRWQLTGERPYPTILGTPRDYAGKTQLNGGWVRAD